MALSRSSEPDPLTLGLQQIIHARGFTEASDAPVTRANISRLRVAELRAQLIRVGWDEALSASKSELVYLACAAVEEARDLAPSPAELSAAAAAAAAAAPRPRGEKIVEWRVPTAAAATAATAAVAAREGSWEGLAGGGVRVGSATAAEGVAPAAAAAAAAGAGVGAARDDGEAALPWQPFWMPYMRVLAPEEAAQILVDAKAEDVVVVDVRECCNVTEYMIIGTGRSTRHLQVSRPPACRLF